MTNYQKYENALQYLEVFPNGDVWRKERTWVSGNRRVCYHPRQLAKTRIKHNGYLYTDVCIDGKNYRLYVHRLIATAFIPKPEGWTEEWEVNHKNGVKTDCSVENLEWCTASENIRHAYRTGLLDKSKLGIPVEQYDLQTGETIAVFPSLREAAKAVGGNDGDICNCCRGKRRSTLNFGWRYANEYIS